MKCSGLLLDHPDDEMHGIVARDLRKALGLPTGQNDPLNRRLMVELGCKIVGIIVTGDAANAGKSARSDQIANRHKFA